MVFLNKKLQIYLYHLFLKLKLRTFLETSSLYLCFCWMLLMKKTRILLNRIILQLHIEEPFKFFSTFSLKIQHKSFTYLNQHFFIFFKFLKISLITWLKSSLKICHKLIIIPNYTSSLRSNLSLMDLTLHVFFHRYQNQKLTLSMCWSWFPTLTLKTRNLLILGNRRSKVAQTQEFMHLNGGTLNQRKLLNKLRKIERRIKKKKAF